MNNGLTIGNGGRNINELPYGTQTLRVSYKDADEIYIHTGQIHINDGLDRYFNVTSDITKQLTSVSNSTFYAIYIDPPTTSTVTTTDVEYSDTMPTLNASKYGYYHPTNTTWRCIGFVYINGSGNIYPFYTGGRAFYIKGKINDFVWAAVSGTDVICTIPMGGMIVIGEWMVDAGSTNTHVSTGGETNEDIHQYTVAGRGAINIEILTDSSKQINLSASGSINMQYFTRGFFMQDEIYTK